MKKAKKLIALSLSASMAAGILPAAGVFAQDEQSTSALVAIENFESYDVGVIAEEAGKFNIGNIELNLLTGDKAEIAEENGNKYLKITRGSTSSSDTTIRYNFPAQAEGTVKVAYDFVPEVSSKNFQGFGALLKEDGSNVQNIITFSSDVYVDGSLNSTWYVSRILKTGAKSNIAQTVKINGENSDYTFSSVTSHTDGTTGNGSKTRTVNTDSVAGIRWSMRNHSVVSHNGPDGNTAETSSTPGVYRFDNIYVSNIAELSSVGKITEDFNGYPEGMGASDGSSMQFGYMTLSAPQGDKVSIAKDPTTGNNALKFEKGDNTSALRAVFNFGDVSGKKIKISYDVRFENHSKWVRNFPAWGGVSSWAFFGYGIWWNWVGNTAGMAGTLYAEDKDKYSNIEFTYDPNSTENNITSKITTGNGTSQEKTHTVEVKDFGELAFNIENAIEGGTNSAYFTHMGPDSGTGIYWIDNVSIEIVSLELLKTSISHGDTNVPYNRNLSLTFNEPVAENSSQSVLIAEGANFLTEGVDYEVLYSDDARVMTIAPNNGWKYETGYSVMIGEINAQDSMTPFAGTTINFTTGKYTPYLVNDDFSEFELGQKWEGPQTVTIGNSITLKLTEGDSVEYAYDPVTEKNGLKLIKSGTSGSLDFIYSFPELYTNGKYTVKVNERVQNHSKAHSRWPSMLSNYTEGEMQRVVLYSDCNAWFSNIGGPDNWNWIGGHAAGSEQVLIGNYVSGESFNYEVYNPSTGAKGTSRSDVTENTTLGGVLLRMQQGSNGGNGEYLGTMVDSDTENNPNNDGIAWIYGITVEKELLDVSATSFEGNLFDFDPAGQFTLTFNEELDASTVSPESVKLYKNGEPVTSYEYSVRILEDGKTVLVDIAEGVMYGTTYRIDISKAVRATDTRVGEMAADKSYTIQTKEYEDNINPDIVWSTIPSGAENIDPATKSIILRTDVMLDQSTINKDNIKVYKNGSATDDYTVAPSGLFAIEVGFDALEKDASYKITVTGLKSGGDAGLEMTQDYSMEFTTRGDIYTSNVYSGINPEGTKSVISAELHNSTENAVNYQVTGVLKNADDAVIAVAEGSSGTLNAQEAADISAEIPANASAETFELYIWDGFDTMKPLTKKIIKDAVCERTYGYDNYIDSSKPLNISFIGGSITQQGNYTTPLTASLSTFLRKDNADRTIKYNIQGVGGTGSDLGLYRLQKDVIDSNPDIVFIEFAVNDASSSKAQQTMEGMIRKLMKLNHQPIVILLDLTTENHSSLNAIEAWQPLMSEYEIGYVNVAEYLIANEASESNPDGFVWKDEYLKDYPDATALTATDGVHPTAAGGKVYAEYMNEVLTANPEVFFKKMNYVAEPVSGYEYNNARMVPWSAAEYDTNWKVNTGMNWAFKDGMAQATAPGATLTYKFTGTTIGLYVPKHSKATSATYSIDGGAYTGSVSANANLTTEMPMASMIKSDLPEGEHTITITVDSADNLDFKFGYFMVD